jgi:hypothetical protein
MVRNEVQDELDTCATRQVHVCCYVCMFYVCMYIWVCMYVL